MIYEISFVPHLPSFIVQMRKPISGGRWLNQKGHMGSRSPALWIYLWLFHPASALGKILPLHKQGKKASAPCVETHRASWHVCESAFVLLPDHLQILGRRVWRESAPEALAHSFYTMAKLPPHGTSSTYFICLCLVSSVSVSFPTMCKFLSQGTWYTWPLGPETGLNTVTVSNTVTLGKSIRWKKKRNKILLNALIN